MTSGSTAPRLSVIVPMHNAPDSLRRALAGLRASEVEFELVVADDASTDPRSAEVAREAGAKLVRLERNSGPAVARNRGAELATGDVLVFVDSDVIVAPDALSRLQRIFAAEPSVDAVFGSYDARPDAQGLVTEYRNLLHHFVHHHGPREASTFWAGVGAIRREAFQAVKGFDPSYRRPEIEDIELGMRLRAAGKRIWLVPEIQGQHLKRWRLFDMIVVDVTRRALPWAKLLIERPGTGGDLNLEPAQKLAGVLVALAAAALVAAPVVHAQLGFPWIWLAPVVLLAPVALINRELYTLFFTHKGPLFGLGAWALHQLYYLYSVVAFAWAQVRYRL